MALRTNQNNMEIGKLYELGLVNNNNPSLIATNIWVDTGSINLYISQASEAPSSLSEMTLSDSGVKGIREVSLAPRWLTGVVDTGTPNEIVVTGVNLIDNGSIS